MFEKYNLNNSVVVLIIFLDLHPLLTTLAFLTIFHHEKNKIFQFNTIYNLAQLRLVIYESQVVVTLRFMFSHVLEMNVWKSIRHINNSMIWVARWCFYMNMSQHQMNRLSLGNSGE